LDLQQTRVIQCQQDYLLLLYRVQLFRDQVLPVIYLGHNPKPEYETQREVVKSGNQFNDFVMTTTTEYYVFTIKTFYKIVNSKHGGIFYFLEISRANVLSDWGEIVHMQYGETNEANIVKLLIPAEAA